METSLVRSYYDANAGREWERLGRPYRRLELLSSLRLLERYFPKTGRVCDIGGGPGRYTVELLKRGYRVTLVDFSEEELALARERIAEAGLQAEAVLHGDARDLSALPSETFDIVLLMGPLYHLIRREERLAALREVGRILKPGGMALLAYLNSWGVVRALVQEAPDYYSDIRLLRALLGEFKQEGPQVGFTEAYFATPPIALSEVTAAGFAVVTYAGVEGFVAGLRDVVDALAASKPEVYQNVIEVAVESSELPQYRDITEHLHIVARKA